MNELQTTTIDLARYQAKGSRVFTGRDRGEAVRKAVGLDELDKQNDEVVLIIPEDIYSINPSFFEELFVNVILANGKEKFLAKFRIVSNGEYDYTRSLNEAINRVLRKRSALG